MMNVAIRNIINRPRLPVVDSLYAWWDFGRREFSTALSDPSVTMGFSSRNNPSTTVSVNVPSGHGFAVNDKIVVSGLTGAALNANGIWTVATTPNSATFTYASNNNGTFLTSGGKASKLRSFRQTFTDLSGKGRTLGISGAGTAVYPSTAINFRPSLESFASSTFPTAAIDSAFGTLVQPFSISILLDHTTAAVEFFVMDQNTGTTFFGSLFGSAVVNAGANYVPGSVGSSGKKVLTVVYNGASSKMFLNGTQVGSDGNPGSNSLTSFLIGSNQIGSQPLDAYLDSVIVHSKALTANEAFQIAQYGKFKMGF